MHRAWTCCCSHKIQNKLKLKKQPTMPAIEANNVEVSMQFFFQWNNWDTQSNSGRSDSYWYGHLFVVKFPMHMKTLKHFVTFSFCMCSLISRLFRSTVLSISPDICCKKNLHVFSSLISIINRKSIFQSWSEHKVSSKIINQRQHSSN